MHEYEVTAVCTGTITETWRVTSKRRLTKATIRGIISGTETDTDVELNCVNNEVSDEEDREVKRIEPWQAPSVAAPWWIVTLREVGDDEDSLLILQADTEAEAAQTARETFMTDHNIAEPADGDDEVVFINHIVRCGAGKPDHVSDGLLATKLA